MSLRVSILASGRGSNLKSILTSIQNGECAAQVVQVVSDRQRPGAFLFAQDAKIATQSVPFRRADRDAWNRDLADAVAASRAELIVLAGFMRILGPGFVDRFRGRIINIHPSLLPAFPGAHAPADAIKKGVRVSGCTVHIVDRGVDTGPILAQAVVPVHQDDDAVVLHGRIQREEHVLLPAVIHAIATRALILQPSPHWMRAVWPTGLQSPKLDQVAESDPGMTKTREAETEGDELICDGKGAAKGSPKKK